MVIGFLHTSLAHLPTFDRLVTDVAGDRPVATRSVVDEGLLALARRLGPEHDDVVAGVTRRIDQLTVEGADVIVCTCSTIGGIAEAVGSQLGVPVTRVDRAMAERAVQLGGRIVVLAALESTIGPTVELLASVAGSRPVSVSERVVAGAWDRFEAGDLAGYHSAVADAIVEVSASADVIVLAQASMDGAAASVDVDVPVLSSPRLAVASLLGARS